MKNIIVDDKVYAYLSKYAKLFCSPDLNHVLKRLLNIEGEPKISDKKSIEPNIDLASLIKARKLQNGERLFFKASHEKLTRPYISFVLDNKLRFAGKLYSMRELTLHILKIESIFPNDMEKPFSTYWHNNEGISVQQLWKDFLEANLKNMAFTNPDNQAMRSCFC